MVIKAIALRVLLPLLPCRLHSPCTLPGTPHRCFHFGSFLLNVARRSLLASLTFHLAIKQDPQGSAVRRRIHTDGQDRVFTLTDAGRLTERADNNT